MGKPWLLYKDVNKKQAAGKSRKRDGERHMSSSSSSTFGGCMSAIFNMFDIHHYHHLPFHQPGSLISESCVSNIIGEPNVTLKGISLKGVEAPRNSLEVEEQELSSSPCSSSLKLKQETNFKIPMCDIQINTKRSKILTEDISSECSSSPSTKTPTLVARLMGLDLLPENSSPRVSSSSCATPSNPLVKLSSNKNNSTRSLPATPRLSTGDIRSRPSTEADYHHRLSLQINKENKRRYDEGSSEYAKQIAKQIRENISRRVAGADITNTGKSKEHRRDEFLVVLKPNRPSSGSTANAVKKSRNLDQGHGFGKENYEPTPISSLARTRLMEIKNNLNKPNSSLRSSPLSSISSTTKSPPLMKDDVKQEKPIIKMQKCKKIASEKYDLRLKKMHQQDQEPCVKKCNKKSTPLSNHLVKVNINTTKFMSFKKDMASSTSSSTTTLPQKQNIKDTHKLTFQDKVSSSSNSISNGNCIAAVIATTATTGSSNSDYFNYISKILNHTGIENTTLISISHWYSPSHPLHPSIFQQIEKICHPTGAADRKLIFAVVDELLVDILKPYISLKPWVGMGGPNSHRLYGSELIGILCEKIGGFPAADCQMLEDIDWLIEGDMRNSTRVVGVTAFADEAEELVSDVEHDVVDTLVGEVARMILYVKLKGIWSNDI
ncbi:uncharacterized protein LOC143585832 [Bidens hawaiensis]|uniref:uncharacterized protein LOC143585832 n=1 Tax=Bidens hawaiensis TaxID=980011 RepID=UPI0040493F63